MKYVITWSIPVEFTQAAIARFLRTGGLPPAGVTMIGRWHGFDSRGFVLAESADPKLIYMWLAQWTDLIAFTISPVIEDADAAAIMQGLQKGK